MDDQHQDNIREGVEQQVDGHKKNNEIDEDVNSNNKSSEDQVEDRTGGRPQSILADDEVETQLTKSDDSIQESPNQTNSFDGDVDEDDPIPSGTGVVSRNCSASDLIGWSEILPKWHGKLSQRPKGLDTLVRNGIPEPLRGEVWQLLSGAQQYSNLMDQYRIFLTKSAPTEHIILRDVHRTYPAHENFRTGSGSTSLLDSLFKVCKAYAVYDEEVGYCQSFSFIVAALLQHMPEEQAFCVFACIMQNYGLRDLFRNNLDELHLKLYQLERLLEEHMPDLYQHFTRIDLEPSYYATPWFLTVFATKFPLNAVFYIMDIFLLKGMDTVFQVSLALLRASKEDLLARDFEGVLKYFRVQMPKLYRSEERVQQLIKSSANISIKRLEKYAKAYEALKQKEKILKNPLNQLQRENTRLTETILRLELDNDDLARDLVNSKIQLRAQLDLLEDKAETLNRALSYSRQDCQAYMNTISDMEDERNRLEVEVSQLKEVCRRELQRAESEMARDSNIIAEYKKICSQLSKRLDHRLALTNQFIESIKDLFRDNEFCSDKKCFELFCSKSNEFLKTLESDDLASSVSSDVLQGDSPTTKQGSPRHEEARQASIESDPTNRPIGAYLKTEINSQSTSSEHKINQLTKHVDELEVELARTKLALVEAECKCQQLTHDMSLGASVTTTPNNSANSQSISQASSLLSNKLGSMKAAISSSNRAFSSPKSPYVSGSASSTFAKLNNMISERISSMGQAHPSSSLPSSTSSPSVSVADVSTRSQTLMMSSASPIVSPNALSLGGKADNSNVPDA